jgi:ketosteroid isomerase-like protein
MTFKRLSALIVPLLILGVAACQRSTGNQGEVEIRQWLDRWKSAFSARDVNAIMSLYDADVVAYDVVPPLQYVGKDAYRKDFEQLLGQYEGPPDVEHRNVHIVAAEDVAFATGLERISGTIKGQKLSLWVRFTSGYRKKSGSWFDVHDHFSVPSDLETGKALLGLKP